MRLRCPHCQRTLEVPDNAAGKQVRCPACSGTTRAPESDPNEEGSASDAATGKRESLYSSPPPSSPLSSPNPARRQTPSPAGFPPGAANQPYSTPVGVESGAFSPPAAGHSEPILYILPGAFQLTFSVVILLVTIAGLVGAAFEFIDGGGLNNFEDISTLVFMIVSLLTTSLIIVGSIQMIRRRSLGFARAAAILAILPCNVCCVVLMPFGIWSTVMLFMPNAPRDFS